MYLSGNCIVYSSWQASLGLFFPFRILHGELGRQRDIIKARMTPLLALLFIEIYARVVTAAPYVHALVALPHDVCVRVCLSIKSACRLIP